MFHFYFLQVFEANLIKEGLELEHEPPMSNGLVFIKIHAPQTVLRCYAEILKLRMPMREVSLSSNMSQEDISRVLLCMANQRTLFVSHCVVVNNRIFPVYCAVIFLSSMFFFFT